MAGFDRIVAMGSIAQVPHEDFARIGFIFLEPGAVTELLGGTVFKMLEYALEHFLEVLGAVASFPADISGARCRIQLYGSHPCAILPAVAHLLEEELHGIEAVEGRAILFLVVL